MNDPYDSHPNHPANQAELFARFGYINPNQFPAMDVLGSTAPQFKGIVDEQLDIEEAEKVAQDLANQFLHAVVVEVSDEDDHPIEERTFDPVLDETLEQLMCADIDIHEGGAEIEPF